MCKYYKEFDGLFSKIGICTRIIEPEECNCKGNKNRCNYSFLKQYEQRYEGKVTDGVFIKGMEMPENCFACVFSSISYVVPGDIWCNVGRVEIPGKQAIEAERPDCCPLIHLANVRI